MAGFKGMQAASQHTYQVLVPLDCLALGADHEADCLIEGVHLVQGVAM